MIRLKLPLLTLSILFANGCMMSVQRQPNEGWAVSNDPSHISLTVDARVSDVTREQLHRFSIAINALPLAMNEMANASSPNGGAVAIWNGLLRPGSPTGVWIWPDWHDSDHIIQFNDFSDPEFRSNHDVVLRQGAVRIIVDVRRPKIHYNWDNDLRTISFSDDNRWAAIIEGEDVVLGRLDNDPVLKRERQLPLAAHAKHILLMCKGDIVVVQTSNGELESYSHETGGLLHREVGTIYGMPDMMWWDDCFIGRHDEKRLMLVRVSGSGEFTFTTLPIGNGEGPYAPSPRGKFIVTHQDTFGSGVKIRVRRTDSADDTQLPKLPSGRWFVGWLSWKESNG